jgi:hypothetical protein
VIKRDKNRMLSEKYRETKNCCWVNREYLVGGQVKIVVYQRIPKHLKI